MINVANKAKAYSEVYSFLNVLGISYISKIPKAVYMIIEEKRDKEYNPIYSINQEVTEETFSKEALALIAALNLQYFCKDEKIKKELKQKYLENAEKEKQKYDYDNIFRNNKESSKIEEVQNFVDNTLSTETHLVEYKEVKWYKKIFEKILEILKK